jgi:hypothetical protein
MYVRVTTLQWQIGKKIETMDEAIRIVEESIVPAAKQQTGFKGFLTLLDRRGGQAPLAHNLGNGSRPQGEREQWLLL